MTPSQRIQSILQAKTLNSEITGLPTFDLSILELSEVPHFPLPNNLRLGHLAERVVSALIHSSSNFQILYERLQIQENQKTLGEIDFIIKELNTGQVFHVELAYKFYLYDPSISTIPRHNWIGPNRNDKLNEKLAKLKRKQFPLLTEDCTRTRISELAVDQIHQSLCLLGHLFTPYYGQINISPHYEKNILGYYLNTEAFRSMDHSDCSYYFPTKTEWGIAPSENNEWFDYAEILPKLQVISEENQSLLCWKKEGDSYEQFFITWW